ncbi:DUF2249 domain-containing protein [Aquisalimonas asiatica]|uniref:Uncharacterized conserved protein, DUF2249 family n=1 Tax=Aquisalimonas asiatica TaxID=406100 RepID=A0A1H8Q4M0_9GAMM|nr:DUF2249 domain-containing protein [Aquisalimonas asiatica]SEO48713.1 Uncharacterized conserved protein, DUF2249 family [Aquisalimonas asiatica]
MVNESQRPAAGHQYSAVLDLRVHDPRERLPLLEMTLSVLQPGEDVLLIAGTEPQRLLDHLDGHYSDRFAIETVQWGPELWQLRLIRDGQGA